MPSKTKVKALVKSRQLSSEDGEYLISLAEDLKKSLLVR